MLSRTDAVARIALAALAAALLPSSSLAQAIELKGGGDRLREASAATVQGQYACGRSTGSYRFRTDRGAIRDLQLTVNGKAVSSDIVASAKRDLEASGFDYATYACTEKSYRFSFFKSGTAGGNNLVTSVSGAY